MALAQFDFTGVDTAVDAGVPGLVAYSGSWRRLNGKAVTSTPQSLRPMLGVDLGGTGKFDISANVSSGGGDAVYGGWVDAANWVCARVRSYSVSGSYYVQPVYRTDYYSICSYANGSSYESYVSCAGSNGGSPLVSNTLGQRQVLVTPGREQGYSTTYYQVVLEKSVGGIVTILDSITNNGSVTKLRMTSALDGRLELFINDAVVPAVSRLEPLRTLTATIAGVGRGPSERSGSGLDNFSFNTLNVAPNAPTILVPSSSDAKVRGAVTIAWTPNDPDTTDTQKSYSIQRTVVATGVTQWWNGTAWAVTSTYVSSSSTSKTFNTIEWPIGKYIYRVSTTDPSNEPSPYSADRQLTIQSGMAMMI